MSAITADGHRVAISGDLTAANARALFAGMPKFNPGEVQIDLGGVGESDSAGLALLLHFSNRIKAASGSAVFINTPAQLLQMAKICGLENFFD